MNALMIAFVELNLEEGISLKIVQQAKALSELKGECLLISMSTDRELQCTSFIKGSLDHNTVLHDRVFHTTKSLMRAKSFIESVRQIIKEDRPKLVYIRHMIPNPSLLKLLDGFRCETVYEIPTYPYYLEQFNASNRKLFTAARLLYECVYWPLIVRKVTRINAIPCKSNLHTWKRMVLSSNGYNIAPNQYRSCRSREAFTLVGMGTIQLYHGYNKILEMLSRYEGKQKIEFYIIGNGLTTPLKERVSELGLQHCVIFLDNKVGSELEEYLFKADVGVGTLALELRGADIDTAIKVLDYYAYGLPVVSSGTCPTVDDLDALSYYRIDDSTELDAIIDWSNSLSEEFRKELAERAKVQFSWTKIMAKAIAND